MRRSLLVVLWLMTTAIPALAAGLHDHADAWLVSGPEAGALLGGEPRRWWLAAGQGRLFGLSELPQMALDVGYRAPGWRANVGWERLGQGVFHEDRATGGWLVGARWCLGLAAEHRRLACGSSHQEFRVWATFAGPVGKTGRWRLDWPVTSSPAWTGPNELERWLRLNWRLDTMAVAVVIDRRHDGQPVVASEVLVRLADSVAWGLRHDGAAGALGLVTAWRRGPLMIRSSHLAHPHLGVTHRWSVGVRR